MANFTIPAAWEFDGDVGNSQVSYIVTPDHTVQENFHVIFDRGVPQKNGTKYSNPSYRVRIRRTFVDADGVPFDSMAVFDGTLRWPLAASAADIKAMVTLVGSIFSDVNLPADIVDLQRLPR